MTESETIAYVEQMDVFEKLRWYMEYYVNMLVSKYRYGEWKVRTFEEFCDKSNIYIKDTGCEDWKERGYASKSWIVMGANSIYHYVHFAKNWKL